MTSHPIINRFVNCLKEAYDIYETFVAENDRPPTREECAMAATLYIEMNKQAKNPVRAGSPAGTGSVSSDPRLDNAPDCCPMCGGEVWDNRGDKLNERSPDFKCKDKECGHAIWLTPPTPKKRAPKRPQRPIAEPDDPFNW